MTKLTHTIGPWILVEESEYPGIDAEGQNIVLNENFGEYCGVRGDNYDEALANARRIVAAVNACEGIPTEALESGAVKTLLEHIETLLGFIEHTEPRDADDILEDENVKEDIWSINNFAESLKKNE